MTDIYENDKLVSAMEPLLELINDINSQAKIQDRQLSRVSEFTEIYNRLRSLYTSDYIMSAIHTIELDPGSFNPPTYTEYDVGSDTGYTINKLSIFTGDIIETSDGKEGMIVEDVRPVGRDSFRMLDSTSFKLIMSDQTIVLDLESSQNVLTVDGSTQLKLKKPYQMIKGMENVIFQSDDSRENLYISLKKPEDKEDEFLEHQRRADEEKTDEMIRQLFPEYFD